MATKHTTNATPNNVLILVTSLFLVLVIGWGFEYHTLPEGVAEVTAETKAYDAPCREFLPWYEEEFSFEEGSKIKLTGLICSAPLEKEYFVQVDTGKEVVWVATNNLVLPEYYF